MISWFKNLFNSPFDSPEKLWGRNIDDIEINYPVIIYDDSIPDIFYKKTIKEVMILINKNF